MRQIDTITFYINRLTVFDYIACSITCIDISQLNWYICSCGIKLTRWFCISAMLVEKHIIYLSQSLIKSQHTIWACLPTWHVFFHCNFHFTSDTIRAALLFTVLSDGVPFPGSSLPALLTLWLASTTLQLSLEALLFGVSPVICIWTELFWALSAFSVQSNTHHLYRQTA